MKRIVIILTVLCIALCSQAQTEPLSDTLSSSQDNICNSRNFRIEIDLGLSAGASLLSAGGYGSPYYSNHGFFIQLPLMTHWQFAPHWKLSAGLRYDFNWYPLYYNVEVNAEHSGICFLTQPTTATLHSYAYSSYVGVPVEIKWYPNANNHGSLGVSLDLFTGYAVSSNITINERQVEFLDDIAMRTMVNLGKHNIKSVVQPWKVEMGLSLTTSTLGLIHGIRVFTNFLPTFIDPATDTPIYTSGISIFL